MSFRLAQFIELSNCVSFDLTDGEMAFYINCEPSLSVFHKNIHPNDINYSDDGLSSGTLQMIRKMGPLLLEKGPDGYIALEHVRRRLEDAHRSSSSVVQGIYSMIKSRIELQIGVLNELDAKQTKHPELQG